VRARILGKEVGIGESDEEHGVGVSAAGHDRIGLKFEFGGADVVFDEEDFFGAALEDVEAAVFVPFGAGLAEFFVLQKFDGDVAEGMVARIAGDVGERCGKEASVTVGEFDGDGIFAFDGVDDFGGSEGDVNVVVAVPVHESFRVRRDFDAEDADLIVGENLVVMRLGGDLDFGGGLGG
jgi:hypothetical protein